MSLVRPAVQSFLGVVKTLRLALPKIGVGWMFALLTVNFNRIAIFELGITALLITSLLGLHYFLSPFQVIFGRIGDNRPILGLRRTPYMLGAALVASLSFLALPSIAFAIASGSISAVTLGVAIFLLYGICIAIVGDAHHSLIAETTTPQRRGGVIAVVWTFTIISGIASAIIMKVMMPEYSPAAMQSLYNITPFIVMGSALLGIVGIEKRLTADELTAYRNRAREVAPPGNPIQAALSVLNSNPQARGFFAFVFLAIFAIFLQDNILEVFGGEVFGMTPADTTVFQQTWGGGVLLGMLGMGLISTFAPISKKTIATMGCWGTAAGLGLLAVTASTANQGLLVPALFVMGLSTGLFNIGALSMMMDMTVEGATGLYMGLWGMAQAFGTGISSISAGAFHTGLIESGLMNVNVAYGLIFGFEAVAMAASALILGYLSVERFRAATGARLSPADVSRAMEAGATA